MIYRIKQFYLSLTAKVSDQEREFVKSYLNPEEEALFLQLQTSEQKHSINVARDINTSHTDLNKGYLMRLALLHDIGKTQTKLNPFEKAIIIILDKLTGGRFKKQTQYDKVNSYYHHGEIGSKLLRELGGYDEVFLEQIKHHHIENSDDELLMMLQKSDDRN